MYYIACCLVKNAAGEFIFCIVKGKNMKILFVGDVVGTAGVDFISKRLSSLKSQYQVDFTIINGENSAKGNGISKESADALFAYGADIITTGNHVWRRKVIEVYLAINDFIVRPANYPEGSPGKGYTIVDLGKLSICVINVLGCVYMEALNSPFEELDKILKTINSAIKIIIVDMHAEATSEKKALACYLDGRVSAVLGTHTHVQTAEEQI